MSQKPRKPVNWDFSEDTSGRGEELVSRSDPTGNAPTASNRDEPCTAALDDSARTPVERMTSDGTYVDMAFRVTGTTLPLDHGYVLFAAIARVIQAFHDARRWGIHPVLGQQTGPGVLALTAQSRLKIRLPAGELAVLLPLAGAIVDVDGHPLQIGIPEIVPLRPAASLKARFVTVKGFTEPESFAAALRRQLAGMPNLGEDPERIEVSVGPRRVIRVGSHTVVGFAVGLGGLEAQASLAVQTHGLGGRRHMGAGIFVPPGRREG